MRDAADIRRAVEIAGVRGFARRAGVPVPAVQRLVERGAYPERGPHGAAMRAAVADVLPAPADDARESPGPEGGAGGALETGSEGRYGVLRPNGIRGGWNDALIQDASRVMGRNDNVSTVVQALVGLGSEDVIGDMVAVQLYAAHKAAMHCYALAAVPNQLTVHRREELNQANRLSRTTAALVEALNRHRGKSGQQTVRVEHVTVNDGGQAVIGPVNGAGRTGGRGEG